MKRHRGHEKNARAEGLVCATYLICISGVIFMGAGAKSMQKIPKAHRTKVVTFFGCVFTILLVAATTDSPPPLDLASA